MHVTLASHEIRPFGILPRPHEQEYNLGFRAGNSLVAFPDLECGREDSPLYSDCVCLKAWASATASYIRAVSYAACCCYHWKWTRVWSWLFIIWPQFNLWVSTTLNLAHQKTGELSFAQNIFMVIYTVMLLTRNFMIWSEVAISNMQDWMYQWQ